MQPFIDSFADNHDISLRHILERKEVQLATHFKQGQAARPQLQARPRDADALQVAKDLTERFSKSLEYLGR